MADILKHFLYLDPLIIGDFLAAIDGYIPEEGSIEDAVFMEYLGHVEYEKRRLETKELDRAERRLSICFNNAARFNKIYHHLINNCNLCTYPCLTKIDWENLATGDIVELLLYGSVKVKKTPPPEPASAEKQGKKEKEHHQNNCWYCKEQPMELGRIAPYIFTFGDSTLYPVIAYLSEDNFRVPLQVFQGEVCMLCKIERKVYYPFTIQDNSPFPYIHMLPEDCPADLEVPALIVSPIAIYR